jgi:hypothetical protein
LINLLNLFNFRVTLDVRKLPPDVEGTYPTISPSPGTGPRDNQMNFVVVPGVSGSNWTLGRTHRVPYSQKKRKTFAVYHT